jgi:hypothetical protein
LTVLPLIPAYILFTIVSFFLNLANVYLVVGILRKFSKNFNQPVIEIFAATMFVLPFWIDFYIHGQISCLLVFVLLLSLHCYLKGRDIAGSLLLGLSLALKPITFFQIIFILGSCLLAKDIKLLLKRAIFILIPIIPDVLLFILVPGLFERFLSVGFGTQSPAWFSISFSGFFRSIFDLQDTSGVFIACLVGSVIIGTVILWKIKSSQERILFSFIFGMFGYFLTQIDIWVNQFPLLFPFLLLAAGFLPKYIDQKRFFVLYLIYPAAAEFYNLYFSYDNAAIMPFIPIVSFSLLLLVGYYVLTIYRGNSKNPLRDTAIPPVKAENEKKD